jgi:hypothetical protein
MGSSVTVLKISGRPGIGMKRTLALILAVIVIAVIATAAAALFLFTQSQPLVPAGVVSGVCQNTTSVLQTATPGQTGADLFVCGTSPNVQPAILTSPLAGVATPSFTLPPPYLKLVLISSATGTACPNNSANITLTSGTPITFQPNQGYDYCASFGPVPSSGLPSWSITWNQ